MSGKASLISTRTRLRPSPHLNRGSSSPAMTFSAISSMVVLTSGPSSSVSVGPRGRLLRCFLAAPPFLFPPTLSGDTLRVDFEAGPPLLPSPSLAERLDILLLREQELEEADAAVLAGLVDAQQDEVVGEPPLPHLAVGDLR